MHVCLSLLSAFILALNTYILYRSWYLCTSRVTSKFNIGKGTEGGSGVGSGGMGRVHIKEVESFPAFNTVEGFCLFGNIFLHHCGSFGDGITFFRRGIYNNTYTVKY
jgi:hypothetical protein